MAISCEAIYVDGTVQGVGFRYFTTQKAIELGLTGEVRNLNDGRVEIIACGDQQTIEQLKIWLQKGGPRSARITQIVSEPRPPREYQKFSITY